MLVISRQIGESFMIGDDIEVTVIDVRNGDKVKLGIDAPKEISVHRKEVYDAIRKGAAGEASDLLSSLALPAVEEVAT